KLFGLAKAPPADVIGYYNKWQMPIAIVIGLLIGFGQLLKYKKTDLKVFRIRLLSVVLSSAGITLLLGVLFEQTNPVLLIFLFAAVFAVAGNVLYWVRVLKGRIRFAGGAVGHIGFGLMLVGILSSGAGKRVISINQNGVNLGENFDAKENMENVLLRKGVPTLLGEYEATYLGDTL